MRCRIWVSKVGLSDAGASLLGRPDARRVTCVCIVFSSWEPKRYGYSSLPLLVDEFFVMRRSIPSVGKVES